MRPIQISCTGFHSSITRQRGTKRCDGRTGHSCDVIGWRQRRAGEKTGCRATSDQASV